MYYQLTVVSGSDIPSPRFMADLLYQWSGKKNLDRDIFQDCDVNLMKADSNIFLLLSKEGKNISQIWHSKYGNTPWSFHSQCLDTEFSGIAAWAGKKPRRTVHLPYEELHPKITKKSDNRWTMLKNQQKSYCSRNDKIKNIPGVIWGVTPRAISSFSVTFKKLIQWQGSLTPTHVLRPGVTGCGPHGTTIIKKYSGIKSVCGLGTRS
jgi:hypothetical protein